MGESKFMGEVEAYYQETSGQYPEIKAQIQNDRETMLTERAEADKARRAYQEEERKLASAQRRLEHIKESIRQQKERRREAARSRDDSDDDDEDSLDSIDQEIERLEEEKEAEEDEIDRIKNARDQYMYDEDVHQKAADAAQNRLKKAVKSCGHLAKSLSMHAEVVKFEADKTSNQAGGFGSMSSNRFARGASQNAKADRTAASSKYKTLAGQISSLADQYALLAQTDTGGPAGGSSKAGASKGQAAQRTKQVASKGQAAQRTKQVAMAATIAAAMATGAMYHATRPISPSDLSGGPLSHIEVIAERIDGIEDALTGPDQIVDEEKKRKENEKHMKRMQRESAPWF